MRPHLHTQPRVAITLRLFRRLVYEHPGHCGIKPLGLARVDGDGADNRPGEVDSGSGFLLGGALRVEHFAVARAQGQFAFSQELNNGLLLLAGAIGLWVSGMTLVAGIRVDGQLHGRVQSEARQGSQR